VVIVAVVVGEKIAGNVIGGSRSRGDCINMTGEEGASLVSGVCSPITGVGTADAANVGETSGASVVVCTAVAAVAEGGVPSSVCAGCCG